MPRAGPACVLALLATSLLRAQPDIPRLAWQERSDWINVKTDVTPKAVGDGQADDTAAIQAALDTGGPTKSVYLPPGTYRLTQTLVMNGPAVGCLVVGHGRDTKIVWDGARGGRMFWSNGVAYSRYVGLSWDGRGIAAVGFDHAAEKRFETEVRHEHEAFRNFTGFGLRVGNEQKVASAEILYHNCLFENCDTALGFLTFNDYDNTIDECEFRHCGIGILDSKANFYARNCHFEGSRETDFALGSEHGSSIRRCTSVGSRRFIEERGTIAPVTIQDCHVAAWTDPEGAVHLNGSPVLMFDCSFTRPPGDKPPVKLVNGGQMLFVSNNRPDPAERLVQVTPQAKLYVIPPGKRGGVIKSAEQRFLRDTARIPGKVFDAKRDFGAKGDGNADDTAAIQKCIDAGREHGKCAIAYLPTGRYAVKDTLKVTGADYFVGGTGFSTSLVWKGAAGGTIVAVQDPQNVTLEHLAIGNHDSGAMNNGADILQTDAGKPSRMTYDGVFVFGMYQKKPLQQGLRFQGLGRDAVVVMPHVQGNLHFTDSAQATILANTTFEGSVVVQGKDKRRDGLLGFQTRLATVVTHGLYLKDNHSIVMSDFYVEQADNGCVFEGSPDDPPGRATIQGAKVHFTVAKNEPTKGTAMTIANYGGQIFFGHDQFYCEPTNVRIVQTGDRALDLFLLAICFYNTKPDITKTASAQVYLVGNDGFRLPEQTTDYKADDKVDADSLAKIAAALDDLRRLGEADLKLNHGE